MIRFNFWMMGLLSFLSSCNAWTDIHTGAYNGKQYKIQEKEHKGFSTNHFEWRIQCSGLPAIHINADRYDWGPPYSNDIFNGHRYIYLESMPYSNIPLEYYNRENRGTMLYIPCASDDDNNCNEWFEFFTKEWASLKPVFAERRAARFPEIIGLVSGKPADYERLFYGTYTNQELVLIVFNDGRIQFETANRSGIVGTGVYPKLIMPGKKILIETGKGVITKAELLQFRDKSNNTPDAYFSIEEVAAGPHQENIQQQFAKALAHLAKNNKDSAILLLGDVKEYATRKGDDIRLVKAIRLLADLYIERGDTDIARSVLRHALSLEKYSENLRDSAGADLQAIEQLLSGLGDEEGSSQ